MTMPVKKFRGCFLHLCLVLLTLILYSSPARADVDFEKLYGSDLGMGVGARAMGLGGAFVAVADDASAVFWNPAGLTAMDRTQIFLSAESPADMSAAALIFSPEVAFCRAMDLTFGVSYIRRLRFKGDSGNDNWSGYPAHLLDLAMVDAGEDFSGKINSDTWDTRLSVAFSPPWNKKLSLGVNYIFLQ